MLGVASLYLTNHNGPFDSFRGGVVQIELLGRRIKGRKCPIYQGAVDLVVSGQSWLLPPVVGVEQGQRLRNVAVGLTYTSDLVSHPNLELARGDVRMIHACGVELGFSDEKVEVVQFCLFVLTAIGSKSVDVDTNTVGELHGIEGRDR